ncbi:MAG: hypothetical protein VXZ72_00205, partial [Chlamydiota bacterium]|nr:hypothetical protein [Chlamydiota bacterium]
SFLIAWAYLLVQPHEESPLPVTSYCPPPPLSPALFTSPELSLTIRACRTWQWMGVNSRPDTPSGKPEYLLCKGEDLLALTEGDNHPLEENVHLSLSPLSPSLLRGELLYEGGALTTSWETTTQRANTQILEGWVWMGPELLADALLEEKGWQLLHHPEHGEALILLGKPTIWKDNRWQSADIPSAESRDYPMIQGIDISPKALSFLFWESLGNQAQYQMTKSVGQKEKWNPEKLITHIRSRHTAPLSCHLGKQPLQMSPGDLFVQIEQRWQRIEKEDWLQYSRGRLSFLCDGITWLNNQPHFTGRFFSPSHLEVKEVQLPFLSHPRSSAF